MTKAFSQLPLGTTPLMTDTVVGINNPGTTPVDCQFTISQLAAVIEAQIADGLRAELRAMRAELAELKRSRP